MDYLIKSSAVIFIFYACYKLFLQRDTFFETNRWFLLSGLIIAACVPLIVIPVYVEYTPIQLSEFAFTTASSNPAPVYEEEFNVIELLSTFYIFGLLFFTTKLIIELLSLKRILKTGFKQSYDNFKLIETTKDITPFSFFNSIVYNPKQFSEIELQHVINHEKAHIQQIHSIDTIIAQITCILLWFNPFVWLYKKALQQNLEFIADQKAQYVSSCKKSYQTVLLKASVKNHQLVFTNNFYTSLIKKRIIMLHKSKSKKLNQLKLILVLPLLALFIMSFNTKTIYVDSTTNTTNQTSDSDEVIEIIITKKTSDDDLENIKKELQSKGITFIYKDVKRNSEGEITGIGTEFKNAENTSNYNISGKDGIKSFRFKSGEGTFGVGTIDKVANVKMYPSKGTNKVIVIEEENDNESTVVDVKTLKKNDTVYYIRKNNKLTWSIDDDEDSNILIEEIDEPVYIINDKKVDKSIFEDVDSEDIESVFILKGKNAIKKYGNEGKNGVVIMRKKGSKNLFPQSEDNIIFNSNSNFVFKTNGDEPIYIVDGKVIDKDKINDINPSSIDKVEVLKDKSAIKLYGEKGKNGVVIIDTKKVNKTGTLIGKNDMFFETEEDGPWKIETAVSSVYFVDDNGSMNTIEFVISKNSSDAFLNKQKNDLEALGIAAKFSKVRRNDAGEITSIKISLDDNEGRKSSASWKEKEQAIPDIVLGKSKDDKLYIRAIGN